MHISHAIPCESDAYLAGYPLGTRFIYAHAILYKTELCNVHAILCESDSYLMNMNMASITGDLN